MLQTITKQRKAMKIWRLGVAVATLLLISVIAYGWWDSSQWEKQTATKKIELDADMVMKGVSYSEIKKGVKYWEMFAEKAKFFSNKQETVLTNVKATIYMSHGKKVLLRSAKAFLHKDSRDIDLYGDVRLGTGEYELLTNSLHYNNNKRFLKTRDRIIVRGNGMVLKGRGLSLDITKKRLQVFSGIDCLLGGKSLPGLG